jgi:Flp pilus assembly protein TadD
MAELVGDKQKALDWYALVPPGDRHLSSQLRIAVVLDETGKSDEAQAHLRKLRANGIDDDEKLAESYLLEAELFTRHEQRQEALAAYDRGLKVLPDERRLLYARALLNESMDRIGDAERDLRRIVELDPDDPDALNALGYTLADRTERFDEAFTLIEKALKLKPDEPAIIDSMGWVQYRRGNHDEALKHLERAFKLQPDAEIAAHLGEVMWVTGDKVGARRIWSEGRKQEADNKTLLETIGRHDH